jgi:ribose-phosphate pyrophosphokinase
MLVTTDSIAATAEVAGAKKIKQISVAPLLAEAVIRISQERSVSSLFN